MGILKNNLSTFLATLSGVLLGLSWPESGSFTLFVIIGLVPLMLAQELLQKENASHQKVFWTAFLTFFTWNCITSWWIYYASGVGAVAIFFVNAFFMTYTFLLFHKIKVRMGDSKGLMAFVFIWIAFEYLHLNWSLSDPWLNLGNVLSNRPMFMQWYEFTGSLGGTLWILLINVMSFVMCRALFLERQKIPKWKIGGLLIFIFGPITLSMFLFYNYDTIINPVEVVVIQPNIDPYNEKFNGISPQDQIVRMTNLAESKTTSNTKFIVGPETAIPFAIIEKKIKQTTAFDILQKYNVRHPSADIVIGLSSAKIIRDSALLSETSREISPNQWIDHYNTAMHLDITGDISFYHKSKLVIGVETVPFSPVMKYIEPLMINLGGTTGSLGIDQERKVFKHSSDTIQIAPIICWESVYGEFVSEFVKNGAHLIFILTNDGWWQNTPGYRQHMDYASMRAIECRRSIARSANTGISGFINQRGEVIAKTVWWQEAVLRETINANDKETIYVKYGDYIGRIASFIAIGLIIWSTTMQYIGKEKLA